jgi:hypothetical protein
LIDPRALDENENLLSPQEMAQYEGELAWPERFDHEHDKATRGDREVERALVIPGRG